MQNEDGGWGFYIEGHSTMIGSALSYVALRILGEGEDGGDGAIAKARKWILDHGGASSIPSWGKVYLSVILNSITLIASSSLQNYIISNLSKNRPQEIYGFI